MNTTNEDRINKAVANLSALEEMALKLNSAGMWEVMKRSRLVLELFKEGDFFGAGEQGVVAKQASHNLDSIKVHEAVSSLVHQVKMVASSKQFAWNEDSAKEWLAKQG